MLPAHRCGTLCESLIFLSAAWREFNHLDDRAAAHYLDAQESVRFKRYKFDQHRQAFLASRVLQKTALAQTLEMCDCRFSV